MAEHATGLAILLALLLGWLAVQRAWARVFPGPDGDPDALAGRLGCAGGSCERPCGRACEGREEAER
jgi:hypothetical protein